MNHGDRSLPRVARLLNCLVNRANLIGGVLAIHYELYVDVWPSAGMGSGLETMSCSSSIKTVTPQDDFRSSRCGL
jgi:hypothetical protein